MIELNETTLATVNRTRGRLIELGIEGQLKPDEVALLLLSLGFTVGTSVEYQRLLAARKAPTDG